MVADHSWGVTRRRFLQGAAASAALAAGSVVLPRRMVGAQGSGRRPDMTLMLSAPPVLTVESFTETLAAGFETMFRLPPQEAMYFANRMAVYGTSCDDRRYGQWERVTWSEFTRAKEMSDEYQHL